jgi:monoamine oxidase
VQNEHAKVFDYVAGNTSRETAMPFAPIMEATGLPRARVRFICRHLARKGLLQYCRALWTEDGEPRGSGYGLTDTGWSQHFNSTPIV